MQQQSLPDPSLQMQQPPPTQLPPQQTVPPPQQQQQTIPSSVTAPVIVPKISVIPDAAPGTVEPNSVHDGMLYLNLSMSLLILYHIFNSPLLRQTMIHPLAYPQNDLHKCKKQSFSKNSFKQFSDIFQNKETKVNSTLRATHILAFLNKLLLGLIGRSVYFFLLHSPLIEGHKGIKPIVILNKA